VSTRKGKDFHAEEDALDGGMTKDPYRKETQ